MLLAPGKFLRVAGGETIKELVEPSLLPAISRPNMVILARKPGSLRELKVREARSAG